MLIRENMKYKFEYIWLDGYQPEPNLRSKTKVIETTGEKNEWDANELPIWFFDGSSTQQAEGSFSDCALKPVRVIADPERLNAFLVMCEVLKPDGTTPHETNTRALIPDNSDDFWFGFEQEYILVDESTRRPLGFPKGGYPAPQGMYPPPQGMYPPPQGMYPPHVQYPNNGHPPPQGMYPPHVQHHNQGSPQNPGLGYGRV